MCFVLMFCISIAALNAVHAEDIEILECEPPDFPEFGGYGPVKDFYTYGDVICYHCATGTVMSGGDFARMCSATGHWSGSTPSCAKPTKLTDVQQTSTAEPLDENEALDAVDGKRTTCSSTEVGPEQMWTAKLEKEGIVRTIKVLVPAGNVSYVVCLIRDNGDVVYCDELKDYVELPFMKYHFTANYTKSVSLRITSSSANLPLQLCEVVVYSLPAMACNAPNIHVENGRLMVSRNKATLICDKGFTTGRNSVINCITKDFSSQRGVGNGRWERKRLYCTPTEPGVEDVNVNPSGCPSKG